MNSSKEYILNICYKNWHNQLWFENEDNEKAQSNFEKATENIESIRNSSSNCYEFQDKIIEYFKQFGFKRVQK